jgi:intein-encoded DNA endonuclease-like protein
VNTRWKQNKQSAFCRKAFTQKDSRKFEITKKMNLSQSIKAYFGDGNPTKREKALTLG